MSVQERKLTGHLTQIRGGSKSQIIADGPSSQQDQESALPTGLLHTPDPGRSVPVPSGLRARLVRWFRCTDAV